MKAAGRGVSPLTFLIPPPSAAHANKAIGEHHLDRPGSDSYEDFLKKVVDRTASGWWTVGVLAFVVLYALYRLLLADLGAANLPPVWLRITTFIIYVPIIYATILSFIRLVAILIFTNWLFHSFTINVNPLHPDGSAGLGVLQSMLGISTALLVTTGRSILLIVVNSTNAAGVPSALRRREECRQIHTLINLDMPRETL